MKTAGVACPAHHTRVDQVDYFTTAQHISAAATLVSELTTTGIYLFIYLFNIRSGVARNFRQGVRQSVAFLSVHPVQLPYQVGRTIKKRHDISYRLNEPKIMYFPDSGCVRPLRHLYGYATEHSRT